MSPGQQLHTALLRECFAVSVGLPSAVQTDICAVTVIPPQCSRTAAQVGGGLTVPILANNSFAALSINNESFTGHCAAMS